MTNIDKHMYNWASDLFPITRSITGKGVRDTLKYIKNILPDLKINEIKSGTKVFDWEIPDEWNIDEAYIEDESGKKIVDFKENNLHVVNYSVPVDMYLNLDELDKHLYSIKDQPDLIPYVTSYYKRRWGFCLTHNKRKSLKNQKFHVVIKSQLNPGLLNYGEIIIPGKSSKEILLSTYVCHPSMANNEVSGPVVTTALAKYISEINDRRYSYRIIFIPETIGAIAYLKYNFEIMKRNIDAGFILTCVGDNRSYSFMPSRLGKTLPDRIALHIIKEFYPQTIKYSFLERGSDERQFCTPLVDLPVVSLMRTKYGKYPEYHTSLDNFDVVTEKGLKESLEIYLMCIDIFEKNIFLPKINVNCEPQLGKRGLYKDHKFEFKDFCDFNLWNNDYSSCITITIWNCDLWLSKS